AGGEMRLEIGRFAPAVRIDATHVLAGRGGRDLAALQHDDAPAVRRQVIRRRGARDPAADHDDVRVGHVVSDAAYPATHVTRSRAASPWFLILTVWLALGVTFGLMFSFSVFLVPLLEEFRWSRGLAAGAFSLSAVVQGLLSPLIGTLVDRFGPRRL